MKLAFTNPDYLNAFVNANQEAIKAKRLAVVQGLSARKRANLVIRSEIAALTARAAFALQCSAPSGRRARMDAQQPKPGVARIRARMSSVARGRAGHAGRRAVAGLRPVVAERGAGHVS